jgi:hypothetical protein
MRNSSTLAVVRWTSANVPGFRNSQVRTDPSTCAARLWISESESSLHVRRENCTFRLPPVGLTGREFPVCLEKVVRNAGREILEEGSEND